MSPCEVLSYRLHVSGSEYARYHFALREMMRASVPAPPRPNNFRRHLAARLGVVRGAAGEDPRGGLGDRTGRLAAVLLPDFTVVERTPDGRFRRRTAPVTSHCEPVRTHTSRRGARRERLEQPSSA